MPFFEMNAVFSAFPIFSKGGKTMNTQTNTQGAIHPDYKKEIAAIINSNLTPHLTRERLVDYHENDIASILPQLHKDTRVRLYSILGTDRLADILAR